MSSDQGKATTASFWDEKTLVVSTLEHSAHRCCLCRCQLVVAQSALVYCSDRYRRDRMVGLVSRASPSDLSPADSAATFGTGLNLILMDLNL